MKLRKRLCGSLYRHNNCSYKTVVRRHLTRRKGDSHIQSSTIYMLHHLPSDARKFLLDERATGAV